MKKSPITKNTVIKAAGLHFKSLQVSQPDCPDARSVTRLEEIATLRLGGTYLGLCNLAHVGSL